MKRGNGSIEARLRMVCELGRDGALGGLKCAEAAVLLRELYAHIGIRSLVVDGVSIDSDGSVSAGARHACVMRFRLDDEGKLALVREDGTPSGAVLFPPAPVSVGLVDERVDGEERPDPEIATGGGGPASESEEMHRADPPSARLSPRLTTDEQELLAALNERYSRFITQIAGLEAPELLESVEQANAACLDLAFALYLEQHPPLLGPEAHALLEWYLEPIRKEVDRHIDTVGDLSREFEELRIPVLEA